MAASTRSRFFMACVLSALASPLSSPAARRERFGSNGLSALASPLSSPAARRERFGSNGLSALASSLSSPAARRERFGSNGLSALASPWVFSALASPPCGSARTPGHASARTSISDLDEALAQGRTAVLRHGLEGDHAARHSCRLAQALYRDRRGQAHHAGEAARDAAHPTGGLGRLAPQHLGDGEGEGGGSVQDDIRQPGANGDGAIGVDGVPDARALRVHVGEAGVYGDLGRPLLHYLSPRLAALLICRSSGASRLELRPSPLRGEGCFCVLVSQGDDFV